MQSRVFTIQEVAKILRVSERTIFRFVKGLNVSGIKLPAVKVGRSWRITENALNMFLAENANVRDAVFKKENYIYIKPSEIVKGKKPKKKKSK